ncbi:MAG TPA: acyl-CoA dehydrogenase family protein [Acidimicrobiales bacterium]|nr:acyl-CoA dehydrogenase family protein [Acidimicrobiales bacterium]
MRFSLDDEQVAFRDALRAVFDKECPPAVVRAAWEQTVPLDRSVWTTLDSLGALNVLTDGDPVFATLLAEEAGRAALPFPIIETVFAAAPFDVGAHLVATDLGGPVVAHAADAEIFLLHDDDGLHLVDPGEVKLERVETVDGSRRAARITSWAAGTPVDPYVEAAYHRGALAAAAQLIGLSERMLTMTVEYAKERQQFGVPIGSFQAVKHQLADALKDLTFARPAVRRAAVTMTDRDISMAKAMASDAAETVGRIALQAHGAIGYTVEYDLHLFLKRAWALSRTWGTAAAHRNRVADAIGV